MLVIISDLHLTDGLSGETIRKNAFLTLRQRIKNLAYEASWRTGGEWTYRPIEELHILLLGDILDVIRSPRWLAPGNTARPWSDPQSPELIAKVKEINAAILENNQESLAVLKDFQGGDKQLTVSKRGRHKEDDPQPIKVGVHYMAGNHDWFYHLPGAEYDEIRKSVVDAAGLANDPAEPFPHDVSEDTKSAMAIRKVLEEHGVYARHGDIYDPFNFEQEHGRNASSLGDAIVVELLGRFPGEVEKELGEELPEETVRNFRELDNVKPYAVIPGWINGLLDRTVVDKTVQKRVKKIWDGVADEFLAVPFVKAHDKPWRLDVVDALQAGIKLADGFSLQKIGNLALKYYRKSKSSIESYYQSALEETAYKNGSAHFIVYGHTHDYEVVPLNVRRTDSGILRQLYVNSGTWRRVHKLVKADPDSLQFYDWDVMTYLAFFKGDERRGRRFETWSGSLGVRPELRAD